MIATEMLTFNERNHYRHEVAFDIRYPFYKPSDGWVESEGGIEVKNWLKENTLGRYSIQSRHVLFEEPDDALLCYLRYKG